jgi:hypothetical protein
MIGFPMDLSGDFDETLVNAPKLDGEPEAGLVLGIKQAAVALAAPPV